jgi:hypothetical protein
MSQLYASFSAVSRGRACQFSSVAPSIGDLAFKGSKRLIKAKVSGKLPGSSALLSLVRKTVAGRGVRLIVVAPAGAISSNNQRKSKRGRDESASRSSERDFVPASARPLNRTFLSVSGFFHNCLI